MLSPRLKKGKERDIIKVVLMSMLIEWNTLPVLPIILFDTFSNRKVILKIRVLALVNPIKKLTIKKATGLKAWPHTWRTMLLQRNGILKVQDGLEKNG